MNTYLVLKNKCTINTYAKSTSAAGQVVPGALTSSSDVKCTFLYKDTHHQVTPTLLEQDIVELIIENTFNPTYDQQVTNIRDRKGNIIDAGPLVIVQIKRDVGTQGYLHHYRLLLRRMKPIC